MYKEMGTGLRDLCRMTDVGLNLGIQASLTIFDTVFDETEDINSLDLPPGRNQNLPEIYWSMITLQHDWSG